MTILKQKSKRQFNVNDSKDLDTFANFMKKSTWGSQGCPFEVEDPYLSVPDMIKDKITKKHLGL